MLCELCDQDIDFEPVLPVVQHVYQGLEPLPITVGYIHLSCVKEMLDSLRAIGESLTARPLPHRVVVVDGSEDPNSTESTSDGTTNQPTLFD